VLAWVIEVTNHALVHERLHLFFHVDEKGPNMVPSTQNCVAVACWNLALALTAALGVVFVAPKAAGSGIPEGAWPGTEGGGGGG
jgi:hypothetical protein